MRWRCTSTSRSPEASIDTERGSEITAIALAHGGWIEFVRPEWKATWVTTPVTAVRCSPATDPCPCRDAISPGDRLPDP